MMLLKVVTVNGERPEGNGKGEKETGTGNGKRETGNADAVPR